MTRIIDLDKEKNQYCSKCGHTMTFHEDSKFMICNYCNHKNKNNTRARFKTMFYKTRTKEDYKVIRLEEN